MTKHPRSRETTVEKRVRFTVDAAGWLATVAAAQASTEVEIIRVATMRYLAEHDPDGNRERLNRRRQETS